MDARRVDFELGRIDAINTTKEEILKWIARIILPINIAGLLIGGVSIYSAMKDTVNNKVDKEIDKRIDNFSRFYSYAKETIPVSILVLRASNDSRVAFDKLLHMSKTMESNLKELKELAEDAISNIMVNVALNVGAHISYQPDPALTVSDHIDYDAYRKTSYWTYRVAYIQDISTNSRLSKRAIFDFYADVLEKDGSLRAVEAARQIFQEASKISGNLRNVDQYIDWWKRTRENYQASP
jgi:hypothetical protein